MKVLVALVMALLAAPLFGMIASFCVGGGDRGGYVGLAAGAVAYVACAVLWVRNSQSTRVVLRRALLTLAVLCFAMPIAGIILTNVVTATAAPGEGVTSFLAGSIITVAMTCSGFVFGIFFLVAYVALRAEPQAKPQGGAAPS